MIREKLNDIRSPGYSLSSIGHLSRVPEGITAEVIEVNGLPALLVRVKGQIMSVVTLEVEGDFIRAVRTVRNPDKLAHLNLPPTLGRAWR